MVCRRFAAGGLLPKPRSGDKILAEGVSPGSDFSTMQAATWRQGFKYAAPSGAVPSVNTDTQRLRAGLCSYAASRLRSAAYSLSI